MFSNIGRSLDEDTIEYAWLLEIQLGKLSGRLTSPQLHSLVVCLETLVLLMGDAENELNSPKNVSALNQIQTTTKTKRTTQNISQNVQHTIQQFLQPKSSSSNTSNKITQLGNSINGLQAKGENINKGPRKSEIERFKQSDSVNREKGKGAGLSNKTEEDINSYNVHKLKYKFCRVAVDAIDFWLVESGTALQLWISPVRLATCNLHGKQVGSGLSCIIYSMSLRQMVWQPHKYSHSK